MTEELHTLNSALRSSPIRAVVFDLDGLMFNTEDIFNEVGRQVLRRRDKEMTRELLQQMMGRRAPEALQIMIDFHALEADTVAGLIEETRTLFTELAVDRLAPMPGLFELLSHIEARGLVKGVATSSGRRYLEEILGRFDILSRFAMTLSAEDVTHGKPHPEIYQTAAARLGVAPHEMLVLEDSHAGTTAAVAAGAHAVSVPNDHSRYQDFSHAAYIATRLDDPYVLQLL
ncbi:MAG TPA: HAD family phosphatase [Planctomycetaceae bacterium]|jgi:HAD superfamily hydrolase (TIGR01509 family)